jgi:Concanavalin A-like lectin/glucanases superfamily
MYRSLIQPPRVLPGTNANSYPITSQLTLSIWADKTGAGNNDPRALIFDYQSAGGYIDICNSGHPSFNITASSGLSVAGGTCAATGAWTNYVATYNGSVAILYVNGVQVASASLTGTLTATNPIYIGKYASGGFNFNGLIDDAMVYDRALSAAEVLAMYNAEK